MRGTVLSLAIILSATIYSSGRAQDTTGKLRGRILDANGDPVEMVNIMLEGPSAQGLIGAFTVSDGNFIAPIVPPGTYTVTVTHLAYQTMVFEDVHIRLGMTTS
ncbi:carboxypeptidase-like regulatory domain-containing protein, partial [Gemmatimonadota bacterium]